MGIYAQFWHCHPAGLADEFLSGPLEEFDSWLLEIMAAFPDDVDPAVYPLLQTVQANGRTALHALTAPEAAAVDRLMDAYFGMFCDMKRGDVKRSAEQSLLRAPCSRGMLGSGNHAAALGVAFELWNFVFSGRAVARDSSLLPYVSGDGVYHLSYWSLDEVRLLDEAFAVGPIPEEVDLKALAVVKNALASALTQRSGLIIEIG
ncbi:hypothetical protein [Variovorax sp. E3]|jgi:hypothetical protein|uniref:hypothetical protein n=1 Tax=Variovorax sp. E3 TaxID=1914993 RepID=UPI0018DC2DE4|nr:hypothetical protein [Variovorax sp. E3]